MGQKKQQKHFQACSKTSDCKALQPLHGRCRLFGQNVCQVKIPHPVKTVVHAHLLVHYQDCTSQRLDHLKEKASGHGRREKGHNEIEKKFNLTRPNAWYKQTHPRKGAGHLLLRPQLLLCKEKKTASAATIRGPLWWREPSHYFHRQGKMLPLQNWFLRNAVSQMQYQTLCKKKKEKLLRHLSLQVTTKIWFWKLDVCHKLFFFPSSMHVLIEFVRMAPLCLHKNFFFSNL